MTSLNTSTEPEFAALAGLISSLLNPPPALPVWQWAELRRKLGRDVTAKPGPYSVDFAPYQKEPQEAFLDPVVRRTILYMGRRLGKTEIVLNGIGAKIEQDPGGMLVVYPTLESGKKFKKQFFNPMARSTEYLKSVIKDSRTRDANNTVFSVHFPGGVMSIIGANSPSGFRQVQAPFVFCDEIDAMETTPEGDPVELALGRAENYSNSVLILASTATFLETSRIHREYEASDKRRWFVKAPCCGKSHVLAWSQMKWPKDRPEEAYYECPDCGNHWDDKTRLQAIRAGEWRPTAPFKGIRGYWLNGLNSVFPPMKGFKTKMHQFAADFLDAYAKGETARLVWKNQFLCEPEEIRAESIDKAPLMDRQEDYGPQRLPTAVLLVIAAADVQADRIEYEICGWGENEESWGIEYGKVMGDTDSDQVWKDFAAVLGKKFKRVDGVELGITSTAIDHNYRGKMVQKFRRYSGIARIFPVYGTSGQKVFTVTNHKRHLTAVNADGAKDIIFARMRMTEPGPRYMHFPKGNGYEEQYFDGLTAEEVRIRYTHGFPVRVYHKEASRRNEPLDIRVYLLANLDILRPVWAAIKASLPKPVAPEAAKEAEKPEPKPDQVLEAIRKPVPRPPMMRRFGGGGWVGGWRK